MTRHFGQDDTKKFVEGDSEVSQICWAVTNYIEHVHLKQAPTYTVQPRMYIRDQVACLPVRLPIIGGATSCLR